MYFGFRTLCRHGKISDLAVQNVILGVLEHLFVLFNLVTIVRTCIKFHRHLFRSRSCGVVVLRRVIKRRVIPYTQNYVYTKLPIAPRMGQQLVIGRRVYV